MNERIRELSRQAVIEQRAALTDLPPLEEHVIESILSLRAAHDKKFAELIIRECAKICDQQGRCGWNDDRKQQARVDAELIREHFGIE